MANQLKDQAKQVVEQELKQNESLTSDDDEKEILIMKLQTQQETNDKNNENFKLLISQLQEDVSNLTSEIETLKIKSEKMTTAPLPMELPVIEESKESSDVGGDGGGDGGSGGVGDGGGLSKEETQKIVLEVMQHNLQNMVQQATQAAETTSVRAVDSGLKKIKKDCETSLSNSDKALKEIEEMKEKEKMAALVSSRGVTLSLSNP